MQRGNGCVDEPEPCELDAAVIVTLDRYATESNK